jgi:uncharacterized protein YndB with AHSA1/START domain
MTMASSGPATVTLPSDTELLITREFAAPRHLVFKAWTAPHLIERWWAGKRGKVTSIEVDLRPGGRWRYVMIANRGFEVAFHGEYREVVPNERLVYTEVFEGMPDASALDTVTFTERSGRTTVTVLVKHGSKANRDAHLDSGMEGGMQEALDLLEQVASSIG